jgi:hypothetical protein
MDREPCLQTVGYRLLLAFPLYVGIQFICWAQGPGLASCSCSAHGCTLQDQKHASCKSAAQQLAEPLLLHVALLPQQVICQHCPHNEPQTTDHPQMLMVYAHPKPLTKWALKSTAC